MNFKLSLPEVIRRGALSKHFSLTAISADRTHELCQFAARANDALALLRRAAEAAQAQQAALNPQSIITFLADNQLMLEDLSHGETRNETEDPWRQPAGAAEP